MIIFYRLSYSYDSIKFQFTMISFRLGYKIVEINIFRMDTKF